MDQFGRDLLSRINYGIRTTSIVGLSSALVGGVAGLVLRVGSACFGGLVDLVLQRVFDVLMAFPLIMMALAVVAIFATGVQNVIVAVTIPLIPRCARVVRSSALAIREIPYVDAAGACGYGHARIILRHMVPNVVALFPIMSRRLSDQRSCRGVVVLSQSGRAGAGAVLGSDVAGRGERVCVDGAVDRYLQGLRSCCWCWGSI